MQIEGSGTRIRTELVRLFLWILHNNRTAMNLGSHQPSTEKKLMIPKQLLPESVQNNAEGIEKLYLI